MNLNILAYFLAIPLQLVIRAPYVAAQRERKVDRRISTRERVSLTVLFVGLMVVPIVYAATDLLAFADYRLPTGAGAAGVAILVGSLLVFWRSHADLGLNWSPSLEIRERHQLVTRGIYRFVRHPMYASLLLWVIAQPLLLQNYVAGGLGAVTFALFYGLRVPPEERMMLDTFGEQYRGYMRRVGGLVPRLPRA